MSPRTTRRRFPWWLLLVAFIGIPILEIYVLIQVGQVIGAWWTIVLLIADSILGSWLLKREGGRAWRALQVAISERRMPTRELADGILIVVGGTLMISPGFVTDVFGMIAILPFTRPLGRRALAGFISRRVTIGGFGAGSTGFGPRDARNPGPDVVRGDVIDTD
ncbi:MAG: FxsA family protein [Marmoricola sp.]